MKKVILLQLSVALLVFASCSDQASNNTSVTEDSTTTVRGTTDTTTTLPPTPAQEYAGPPSDAKPEEIVKDTPKTSVSVGKDGASVKTKKGTNVSYDKKGVKVEGKDVKIDIKRDTL